MAALDKAFRGTPGLRRVTTEARDLFRRPLLTPGSNAFDAVVVDPPRAGAEAQAKQLPCPSAACRQRLLRRRHLRARRRRPDGRGLSAGAGDPRRPVQAQPSPGGGWSVEA